MFELKISDFDFKLYSYLCKNYDPLPQIKAALQRLSIQNIDYKPLITHKNFTYFDMPRYKHFLETIKFQKNFSNKGFNKVKQNIYTYQNGNYDN